MPGAVPPAAGPSPSRCRLPRRQLSPQPRRPPCQCLGSHPVCTEREREAPAPAAPLGGTHPRPRLAPPSCRGRGRAARSGPQHRRRVVPAAERGGGWRGPSRGRAAAGPLRAGLTRRRRPPPSHRPQLRSHPLARGPPSLARGRGGAQRARAREAGRAPSAAEPNAEPPAAGVGRDR